MTIIGENTALTEFLVEAPASEWDTLRQIERSKTRGKEIAEILLPKLQDEDVIFDTDTGIVEFTHDGLPGGPGRQEREIVDWVNAQMFWIGLPEIDWDAFPNVLRSLSEMTIGLTNG